MLSADLLAEVALDAAFGFDDLANLVELILIEGSHLDERVDAGLLQDARGRGDPRCRRYM